MLSREIELGISAAHNVGNNYASRRREMRIQRGQRNCKLKEMGRIVEFIPHFKISLFQTEPRGEPLGNYIFLKINLHTYYINKRYITRFIIIIINID